MAVFRYQDIPVTWHSMTRLMPEGGGNALPEVASVDALDASGTRWRVTFAAALLESPALSCVGTYELVGASGHRPAVLAATPEAGATPGYVDLETAEHTAEASYTLTLHFLEVA